MTVDYRATISDARAIASSKARRYGVPFVIRTDGKRFAVAPDTVLPHHFFTDAVCTVLETITPENAVGAS